MCVCVFFFSFKWRKRSTKAEVPRAHTHPWPWPSPWLTNAAGFPEYPSQSPHLFLWDWCLFLDSWVLQRQYKEIMPILGQVMREISWQHGRLEGDSWRGLRKSILGTSGIMLSKPASSLTTGLTHPPGGNIYSFHCGRSTTWYKLSRESFRSVLQYLKVCALTQHFCFQESISQSFLCNCAQIKV